MPELDRVLNLLLPQPEVFDLPDFTIDQSIIERREYQGEDTMLAVVIPPWHANKRMQTRLEASYTQAGHSVLSYSLHDNILSTNPNQTINAFEYIGQDIADRISRLRAANPNLMTIHFTAASLGCAILTYTMGTHGLEGSVDMIAPGGNLASGLWRGIRTQHLREAYESQGLTEPALRGLWHELAPAYQATKIRNSRFRLFTSAQDLVIPNNTLENLDGVLLQSGNSVEVYHNKRLGHFGTILLQHHLKAGAKRAIV